MNDKGKMPMNSAARNDLSSRRCVRLPILIAAMLIVISTVFTGSGLTGTAQAQAERGAIPSVSLDSNEPGQLVITRQTPDPAPTDYRISWAHSSLGFLSYRDSNEAQRGNAYPSGNENTLTLDGLTPGEIYKVQLRARYYTANRSAHEWSGPWTGTSTTRVMDEPAKPPPPEETPQPAAPTGLTVARVGHSVLTLTWNDPQDERITGYRVLRGASVDSLSTIEENTGGVGTEYADDTVAPETTYHYAVIALSAVGDGAQSDAVSATTTAAPKPKKQPTPESARQSTTRTDAQTVTTFISNTGQTGITASVVRATEFTTGTGTYTLSSVGIYLALVVPAGTTTPVVQIYGDTGGNPGTTLLATMTNPGTFEANAVNIFTAPANTTLSASTTYWVVTSNSAATDGTGFVVGVVGNTTLDSGTAAGWSIGAARFKMDIAEASWSTNSFRILFAIRGTGGTTTNNPPTVATAIPDQSATAGTAFSYVFPANTFSDADTGDTLSYTATKTDDTALPTWLSFAASTRTFSGTPQAADTGTVSVKVTASDGNGGSVSDEFDIIVSAAANTPATGAPTITGTAQVGQTLTAVTTAIMDANGLTSVSYAYQWIRVATDNTETNIASATASTHTLVAADQGKTIKVKVSFTDDASNAETLTSAATAAVAAAAAPTEVPASWNLKPTGLAAGDQFRLVFLSSTRRDGSSTDIAVYNTFVQGLAAAGHADIRAYSAGFRAVGCTADTDARDNTGTTYTSSDKGVPIYWLDGAKAADQYEDFYDGSWDEEANDKNESGTNGPDTSQLANYPLTGCDHDGTEELERALGASPSIRVGRPNSSNALHGPISNTGTSVGTTTSRPMYGLSGVFLVSDSPSSMEPAAVSDVVVVPVPHTTDSLQVSWSAPDNTGKPALTGYDVRYKLDSPLVSVWTVERQAASSTSVTIDGLDANDYMFVQVRAVNAEEDGPWSSTAEALTSPSPEVVLANHPLVPDDLDPGDSFRLLFVTSATKAASGTGIHDYNIFVSDPAFKLLESGNLLEQWDSIGVGQRPLLSLPGAHARLITDTTWTETDRGVPIYWLNGARVADDYADFYDGTWADEANPTNGLGNARSLAGTAPWTGTDDDGTELFDGAASRAVGQASVSVGGLGSTIPGAGPLNGGAAFASTQERPLYGLWHVMVVDEDLRLGSNSLSALNATGSSDNRAAVRAQLFTTGSHSGGYGISLIEFFKGSDEDDLDDPSLGTVALYTTDTNGDPDLANGLHATLSVVSTSSSRWGLAAPVGTVLKPSTTYALVFQGDGSLYPYLETTNTDGEDLPGAGWSIADVLHYWSGTSWVANSNGQALTMEILGPRLEDTEGPALASATVVAAGNAVTLVFGEDVTLPSDSAEALTFLASLASAFAVTGGGDDVTVSALTADSANPEQLTIGLSGVILQGQAVTLTYTDPTAGDDAVALQDVLGNETPTFTTGLHGVPAVINNSAITVLTTTVPGAPTGLTATASGSTQINLSWTVPASDGGSAITGYKIEVSSNGGSSWTDLAADTGTTTTTYAHTGLAPGSTRHYRVSAINTNGSGTASNVDSATTGTTVPGAPSGLTATASGSTQINLSWSAPGSTGGSAITGYRIEVSSDGGSSWSDQVANTSNTTTTYAHTGLAAGTTRHYRVSAINANGSGTASNVDSATTATTVPGAPTGLTATASGTTAINLSWTAPASTGGSAITGYKIEVSSNGGSSWTDQVANTSSTATTYAHTGLASGDTRHYRVSAINTNGSGTASNVDSATTGTTVPGAPTGLTATASGSTQINLSWSAPASTGGSAITGYRIEVSPNGASSWTDQVANTGNANTTYAHTGLTAGTTRHYRVSAINANGSGTASNVDSATTGTTVPGAPSGLSATASGTTQINLSWSAPASTGGSAITGYNIEVSSNGGTSWTTLVADTGNANTTYQHTGLTAPSTRHYRVSAINANGSGVPSNVDSATTGTTVPGAPSGLTATASGSTQINLSWSAPASDGGSAITGYRIEVSPNGASGWTDQVANTGSTTTTYAHTGLAPGSTRHYRVSAINTNGSGTASNVDSATTGQTTVTFATLSALTVSPKDIIGFVADRTSYEVGVASTVTQATITATKSHSAATVAYSTTDADTSAGHQLNLSAGRNEVTITVTAEDTTTTGTYTLSINRGVTDAFGWKASDDFDGLITAENNRPRGMWSDGTTMWVTDWIDIKIYAYDRSTKAHDASKDFDTLDAAGNDNPRGIWSDGTTVWVSDYSDEKLYAYDMTTKARDVSKDFDTANLLPTGIWSDGTTMWVAAQVRAKIYAYDMSTKARDAGKDFDTLEAAGNNYPGGIWSNNITMWVAEEDDEKLYAYNMASKARDADKDFNTLNAAGNGETGGIWANTNTMWASDTIDYKIYSYNMPLIAPNTPAAGLPAVTAPNVFRVPAVLSADLTGITDTDRVTGIATNATYKWQRFAANGTTLDTDSVGTGSTYTLTDADAGKTLKVVVSFTDNGGNSEGPLTSAATSAITAAAICAAPSLTGGATFLGAARKLGVGKISFIGSLMYGYSKASGKGSLDNARFTTAASNNYEIVVINNSSSILVEFDTALTADDRSTLVVHICDQAYAFSSSDSFIQHEFTTPLQNWAPHAERTIYLSQDTAAPTFASATVNGTSLVITLSEPLGAAASLANSAFTVKKGPSGSQTTLTLSGTAPVISGSTVTLTLAAASTVSATDTNVLVTYTKPGTGTANKLVDAFGNETGTFADQVVTNLLSTTVPGAPTGLTATASGTTAINLSWSAPASTGGSAITGYKIESSSDGGSSWSDLVANTGNANTTYAHTGLAAGDTRHYRVSAINANGSGAASNVDSATTDATVPGAPSGLTATASGTTAINLSWTAPGSTGGSAITGYKIESSSDGGSSWSDLVANTGNANTTYAHIGLTASSTRHYRVSAINTNGTGTASNVDSATTGTTVPGAPSGLSATASGSNRINLSWTAPAITGGSAITGYKIEVSSNGGSSWTNLVADTGNANTTYQHIGLTASSTRHYRVSAINANGSGTASNVDSATTGTTVPGAPSGLTATASGTTAINLSWTAPGSTGGSAITGYKIESSSDGGSSWSDLVADTGNANTTYQHIGLTASSTRHYRVSAINANGSGTASNVDSATTGTTVPGAPSGLTATASGTTAINLSWTAPGSTGGSAITGYKIESSSDGGSSWSDLVANTGNANTTYAHIGLTASSTRHYRVSAINANGSGTASNVDSATTGTTVPGAPSGLSATASGSNRINLSWTAPAITGGSAITGYKIEVSSNGGSSWTNLVADTGNANTTYQHIGLTASSTRHYRVSAINANGSGTASNVANATTGTTVPGAPTGLTATASGSTQINLSWTAPGSTGGSAITGYKIEVSSNGGSSWTDRVANTSSTTTTYAHSGLGGGTTRHYRVSAINTNGTGTASNVANATTGQTTVTLGASSYTAAEGGATATVAVQLSAAASATVTIPLTKTHRGGATAADYSGVPSNVTFTAGQTRRTFTVTATDDADKDGGESVQLGFGTLPAGYAPGARRTATVTLVDDDADLIVNFGTERHTTVKVRESDTVWHRFTFSLSTSRYGPPNGNRQQPVTIPLVVTHRGGATPADYEVRGRRTLTNVTFGVGESVTSFSMRAIPDGRRETGEGLRLDFGRLPPGVSKGDWGPYETIAFVDQVLPGYTVLFGAEAYTATEGGAPARVTIHLNEPVEIEPLEVRLVVTHVGATAADYTGIPKSVTFGVGEQTKTITVRATDDTDDDDGESVTLSFVNDPNGRVRVRTGPASATVALADNDGPRRVTVSFGAATYTATEGGADATVRVELDVAPGRSVTVPLTKTHLGNATAADYSGIPEDVTFAANQRTMTITVTATVGDGSDGGESVSIGFGTLPEGVFAGSPAATTVTLADGGEQRLVVNFGSSRGHTVQVREGARRLRLNVLLNSSPRRPVTIPLVVTHVGGATAADYDELPSSVTFAAGQTSSHYYVRALPDLMIETGEGLRIDFGPLPPGVRKGTWGPYETIEFVDP